MEPDWTEAVTELHMIAKYLRLARLDPDQCRLAGQELLGGPPVRHGAVASSAAAHPLCILYRSMLLYC
jgi:hypothetical protein